MRTAETANSEALAARHRAYQADELLFKVRVKLRGKLTPRDRATLKAKVEELKAFKSAQIALADKCSAESNDLYARGVSGWWPKEYVS